MPQEQLPPASENENTADLRAQETVARIVGAVALGLAGTLLYAEIAKAGTQPPDFVLGLAEGRSVAIGTYSLSLAAKFGRQT